MNDTRRPMRGQRSMCLTCGERFLDHASVARHRQQPGTPTQSCLSIGELRARGFLKDGAGFWFAAPGGVE
jgi:hypothetical protein